VAKKAKARTILVKLLSTASTGYFYVRSRPRVSPKLSFIKFDPRVNRRVLFNEAKMK
ncbi:50S ribosomal protein L33, partial [Dimargaris cristalligena]